MDAAKIRLSEEEKRLISDTDWILTKNSLLARVNRLLLSVLHEQQEWLAANRHRFTDEVLASSPKISRGENYQGLPWLVLDHPRIFLKDDTCAVRTFFWWGNFFSTTLQLSGRFRDLARQRILNAYPQLCERRILAGIADDAWEHHLGQENYRAINDFDKDSFRAHIHGHPFIKLTAVVPLSDWDSAVSKLGEDFRLLMELLVA